MPEHRDPRGDALERALHGYLAHLRVERGLSPNTLAAYERDLQRYISYLRGLGLSEPQLVGRSQVAGFLEALRTGTDGARPLAASSA